MFRKYKYIVFGMINAAYYDKTLIFIKATFREKLVSYHQAINEADSYCLLKWRASSKPWHKQTNHT